MVESRKWSKEAKQSESRSIVCGSEISKFEKKVSQGAAEKLINKLVTFDHCEQETMYLYLSVAVARLRLPPNLAIWL